MPVASCETTLPWSIDPHTQLTDELLAIPQRPYLSVTERLELIQGTCANLGNLILKSLAAKPEHTPAMLRATATLACVPSLNRLTTGRPHDHETAIAVSDNFHTLATSICEQQLLLDQGDKTLGTLSEVSILALLWTCIANGNLSADSYALPTTTRVDVGTLNGLRDGYDIILRTRQNERRGLRRYPIQVKTKHSPKDNTYEGDILIITPSDCWAGAESTRRRAQGKTQRAAPRKIIGAIAAADHTALQRYGDNVVSCLRSPSAPRR